MSALFPFHGGVKTVRHKAESNQRPIQPGLLPSRLVVPLHQHVGATAKPMVQPGDRVLKGQMIGKADGYVSAAVHAPTSGRVMAVDQQPVPHPSGLPDWCVTLEADGEDRWIEARTAGSSASRWIIAACIPAICGMRSVTPEWSG